MENPEIQIPTQVLHSLHSYDVPAGKIGVTVRRGNKWSTSQPGTFLDLCCCVDGHKIVGMGEILKTRYCPFDTILAKDIELEHEGSSRLYSGLLESMRRAYGEEFKEDEYVTLVFYRRLA